MGAGIGGRGGEGVGGAGWSAEVRSPWLGRPRAPLVFRGVWGWSEVEMGGGVIAVKQAAAPESKQWSCRLYCPARPPPPPQSPVWAVVYFTA